MPVLLLLVLSVYLVVAYLVFVITLEAIAEQKNTDTKTRALLTTNAFVSCVLWPITLVVYNLLLGLLTAWAKHR